MECSQVKNKIYDYIEGKLGKEDLISFEQHLQSCRECSSDVRLLMMSEKVISHEKSLSPGYFLTEKVMTRIRSENKEENYFIRILRPAVATLSVAAAIFAGVLIGNLSKEPTWRQTPPLELSLMNDIEIESIDDLATD